MAQRQVQAARAVAETDAVEPALSGLQLAAAQALDQGLVVAAVGDQVGDGADLQAVLAGEHFQIRQPGHAAVVVHDLADHGRRRQACHGRHVATGLSVAGAHQHAAVLGLQREDVAGLHQVFGLGVTGHGGLHGARTVGGRDAGGDTVAGLDGHGEGRAMGRAVALGHRRQAQSLAALAGQRQADQAAAVLGHEVDGFGRHMVGGDHEVAFVLAVFLVDQDHHAAGGQFGHQLGNRGDGHGRDCRRGPWRPCAQSGGCPGAQPGALLGTPSGMLSGAVCQPCSPSSSWGLNWAL